MKKKLLLKLRLLLLGKKLNEIAVPTGPPEDYSEINSYIDMLIST